MPHHNAILEILNILGTYKIWPGNKFATTMYKAPSSGSIVEILLYSKMLAFRIHLLGNQAKVTVLVIV